MKRVKPLTASKVESARCPEGARELRLRDSLNGLFLRVTPAGSKTWYCRRRTAETDTSTQLGEWPDVDLREARRLAAIKAGEPLEAPAPAPGSNASGTFGAALDEHITTHRNDWRPATRTRQTWLADCLVPLRPRPLKEITARELKDFLLGVAEKGNVETAHRLRSLISNVFDDAVDLNECASNPAARLGKGLPKRKAQRFAAVTDRREFGRLLVAVDEYEKRVAARSLVGYALRMLALVPVRQVELRHMRWSDLDLEHEDGPLWSIPDEHVKTKVKLAVPLPSQAVEVLKDVEIYGDVQNGGLVFEGRAGTGEPLSENAIRTALIALGYEGKHVGHGFRSSFSTLCHEKGWRSDLIELAEGRKVAGSKAKYLRSTLLGERRKLMQDWADYCDELKADARAKGAGYTGTSKSTEEILSEAAS